MGVHKWVKRKRDDCCIDNLLLALLNSLVYVLSVVSIVPFLLFPPSHPPGDEGVPESPPTLAQFKGQVDSYEKVYSEVEQFKVGQPDTYGCSSIVPCSNVPLCDCLEVEKLMCSTIYYLSHSIN